jgi:4-amino-4-deoxy-L-arabinose transferase-like glycosyltransferase
MPRERAPSTTGGFQWALAAISLAGLAIRVGYVLLFRRGAGFSIGDSYVYSQGANLVASGHGFVNPLAWTAGISEQSASHPPLYLLWLTVASFVDPGSDTSPLTHMLWSCVLGAGSVALCALVGRRVGGRRAGLVAAALAAVYPNIWLHDGMLLSETASIFTVALTLLAAYRFWDSPTAALAGVLGACGGLAALSRPELILMVPLLLLPTIALRGEVPWPQRIARASAGAGAALAVLAPWIIFNLVRFEEPVYISTNLAGTLAAANCDSTYYGDLIGYKDYGCAQASLEVAAAQVPDWDRLDQSQRDQAVRREVSTYVGDHRARLPVVMAARMGRLLKLYGVGQEIDYDDHLHGQERGVVLAGLASWYVVAGLAVAGAVILRRRRQAPIFPLLALPAIILATVAVTFAQTRYRAPAEPAVAVLTAVAIDAALPRRRTAPGDEADAHKIVQDLINSEAS